MQLIGPNKAFAKRKAVIKQKGFTLIELMIVVAIIGVLAAIAMPQYNKYVARTQVAEAYALLAPVKAALGLYWQESQSWPIGTHIQKHDALGIPERDSFGGDYVARIALINDGRVNVVFDTEANGVNTLIAEKRFQLRPVATTGGSITWRCVPNGASDSIGLEYIKSCN